MPTVVASGQNAYVSFTDGQGSAELVTAAGQFDGWTPNAEDIGTVDVAIGTGYTFKYIYRTDYTASFVISAIPAASMPIAQRLKRWLESGGTVTVATQDTQGNTYSCRIAPKQQVKFGYDATMLEYAMTLAVLNTAASPMTCIVPGERGHGLHDRRDADLSLHGRTGRHHDPAHRGGHGFGRQSGHRHPRDLELQRRRHRERLGRRDASPPVDGQLHDHGVDRNVSTIVPCAVAAINMPATITLARSAAALHAGTTYVGRRRSATPACRRRRSRRPS